MPATARGSCRTTETFVRSYVFPAGGWALGPRENPRKQVELQKASLLARVIEVESYPNIPQTG